MAAGGDRFFENQKNLQKVTIPSWVSMLSTLTGDKAGPSVSAKVKVGQHHTKPMTWTPRSQTTKLKDPLGINKPHRMWNRRHISNSTQQPQSGLQWSPCNRCQGSEGNVEKCGILPYI